MQGLELITGRLESAGIVYCLVGGLAAVAYGRPRLTLDADLVISLGPDRVQELREIFPEEDFYLPSTEVLQMEASRPSRGHFNVLHQHSMLRADCYFPGVSQLARWELEHRRQLRVGSYEAWFAPPESVVAHKLIFYREGRSEKHLEDIRAILTAGSIADEKVLQHWIDKLGLQNEWSEVLGR
jgi:hypothetical protein